MKESMTKPVGEIVIDNLLKEAIKNKKQRLSEYSGNGYQITRMNQPYPATITDGKYVEKGSVIALFFAIFKNQSDVIQKTVRFKINGGNPFYDEICETLGKEGDPFDLIGEFMVVHFEKNEGFTNLRVDYGMGEQEFREMVGELRNGNKKKKAGHKKHTSQKAVAGKMSVRKARKKSVRFDEFEDMDSESDYEEGYDGDDYEEEYDGDDYEEEYDGDDYDGEYDDRNDEQEYLDDMADFQG